MYKNVTRNHDVRITATSNRMYYLGNFKNSGLIV